MDPTKSSRGRLLQPTEKGAQYQAEIKVKMYKGLKTQLIADGKVMIEAIPQGDRQCIQTQFDAWKHLYVDFVQMYQVLSSLLEQEEKDSLQAEYQGQLEQFNTWKARVEEFLSAHPAQVRSHSECASQCSSTSQAVRDKLFLMKVEEMKMKAETEVKTSMAARQLDLQRRKEELERKMAQEQEMLDNEMERKMNEARIKVLCAAEVEAEAPVMDDAASALPCPRQEEVSVRAEKSGQEELTAQMVKLLIEQKKAGDLPTLEPDVFKGDVSRFNLWLSSFETHIESKTESSIQRLHFLAKYTAGEAKRAINGLLHLRTDEGYRLAKEKLIERFGNDFIIANAYRNKIREWPTIKAGDGRALRDFADHLEHCLAAASSSLKNLAVLDDHLENEVMVKKLPKHVVDNWKKKVDDWLYGKKSREGSRYPPFSEFVRFISVEARIACGPVGSGGAADNSDKLNQDARESRNRRQGKKSGSEARVFTASTEQVHVKKCVKCQGNHALVSCPQVMAMSLAERKRMVAELHLCRGCLKRGHLWRHCLRRAQCETCGRQHPTLLHDPEMAAAAAAPEAAGRAATCLQSVSNSCHCLVVPVLLSKRDQPDHKVVVYALLDAQSDACFVTESICSAVGAKGRKTRLDLSTIAGQTTIDSEAVEDLIIQPLNSEDRIRLATCYTRRTIPCMRTSIPRRETALKWKHLTDIADQIPDYFQSAEIGLLLGTSCPGAIKPLEVRPGEDDEPWAVRTVLGWGIVGTAEGNASMCRYVDSDRHQRLCHFSFRTKARESPRDLIRVLEKDFEETRDKSSLSHSVEDREFLSQVSSGFHRTEDGRVQMPLPLKRGSTFPNNKQVAEQRLKSLRARLMKGGRYRDDYKNFMEMMLKKGYAEPVEDDGGPEGRTWYLAHHGVYHPRKQKLRIVFDCSSEYQGISLNKYLLQGPDLTNSLTGILCRFRREPVAVSCDVEGMFNQVSVNVEDRDLLRFLWWEDGDVRRAPKVYRMTTHLFGARSSPACAMYALQSAAEDCNQQVAEFIKQDFYIDDGLTSVADEPSAVRLIVGAKAACEERGFHLHKFASNKPQVLRRAEQEADEEAVLQSTVKLCKTEEPPTQSVLGIQWNTEKDTFAINVNSRKNPTNDSKTLHKSVTRRCILSVVSSVFDPLGFVSPFVLVGKLLLQELCRDGLGWDEPVSGDVARAWTEWLKDMLALEAIDLPRCYAAGGLTGATAVELHHFSDASREGYGQCSYLRIIGAAGEVSTALVMSKARVAPSKPVTVPRLELTAAVLAVKISQFLQEELGLVVSKEYFWTDSMIVLGYIANEARRFHTFVANRVQQIRDHTSPDQWRHVRTSENPADLASRGCTAPELISNDVWWHGPEFLREPTLPEAEELVEVNPEDKELRRVEVFKTGIKVKYAGLTERLEYFSRWYRAKRAVALCLLYVRLLRDRVRRRQNREPADRNGSPVGQLQVETLQEAEQVILKATQDRADFMKTVNISTNDEGEVTTSSRSGSQLAGLDPFVRDGVLRVGGRIRRSGLPDNEVHPIILPKKSHVTNLIIGHCHEATGHAGRGMTLSRVRASGYWIIGARCAVSQYLRRCVSCRKLRGQPQQQKMADLPPDRLQEAAPFTYSAVDCFGPYYVKEKRSQVKRWGVLFTCLCTRAIHIETANSLSADAFLNAFRRFVARRGSVRVLRSDRGTNFMGGRNELENAFSEMDADQLRRGLLRHDCELTKFEMNVPHASHMGGVWERMIRSARAALDGVLRAHCQQGGFDDELLRTFLAEAEAIVNCRPLTSLNLNPSDASEPQPLCPMQLLTLKGSVVLPPPGVFHREDVYCRRRWRRVQAMADQFWRRWRSDFLPALQQRKKWTKTEPNLQVGDVVVIMDDDAPRSQWPLGRVVEAHESADGLVRTATLRSRGSLYDRPIHRLVRLLPVNDSD